MAVAALTSITIPAAGTTAIVVWTAESAWGGYVLGNPTLFRLSNGTTATADNGGVLSGASNEINTVTFTLAATVEVDESITASGLPQGWASGNHVSAAVDGAAVTNNSTADLTSPTVRISSHSRIVGVTGPIVLSGVASDNVGVDAVTWADNHGGSGTATGTTSWSFTYTPTNARSVVTITAADAAGNTALVKQTVVFNRPVRRSARFRRQAAQLGQ